MCHWELWHKVYIMLWCSPNQIPQLHKHKNKKKIKNKKERISVKQARSYLFKAYDMPGTTQDSHPMNRLHNFDIIYKSHVAAVKTSQFSLPISVTYHLLIQTSNQVFLYCPQINIADMGDLHFFKIFNLFYDYQHFIRCWFGSVKLKCILWVSDLESLPSPSTLAINSKIWWIKHQHFSDFI